MRKTYDDGLSEAIHTERTDRLAQAMLDREKGAYRVIDLLNTPMPVFASDNATPDHAGKRWCSKCTQWLPADGFNNHSSYCKNCRRKYMRNYMRDYRRRRV